MSNDEADLWPVSPSEIVCESPWLEGSNRVENDPDWREILIPDGHGIAEYRINRASHEVILTRIVLF